MIDDDWTKVVNDGNGTTSALKSQMLLKSNEDLCLKIKKLIEHHFFYKFYSLVMIINKMNGSNF